MKKLFPGCSCHTPWPVINRHWFCDFSQMSEFHCASFGEQLPRYLPPQMSFPCGRHCWSLCCSGGLCWSLSFNEPPLSLLLSKTWKTAKTEANELEDRRPDGGQKILKLNLEICKYHISSGPILLELQSLWQFTDVYKNTLTPSCQTQISRPQLSAWLANEFCITCDDQDLWDFLSSIHSFHLPVKITHFLLGLEHGSKRLICASWDVTNTCKVSKSSGLYWRWHHSPLLPWVKTLGFDIIDPPGGTWKVSYVWVHV